MPIFRAILFMAALIAGAPANAAQPAYVGTWGKTAAQCKVPQELANAPMILKAKGYDQHEAHCTFTSVKKSAQVWKVAAACSVQGDKQKDAFTLKVASNKLTMSRGKAASTFVRCP
jgi:hypothetical protein